MLGALGGSWGALGALLSDFVLIFCVIFRLFVDIFFAFEAIANTL